MLTRVRAPPFFYGKAKRTYVWIMLTARRGGGALEQTLSTLGPWVRHTHLQNSRPEEEGALLETGYSVTSRAQS